MSANAARQPANQPRRLLFYMEQDYAFAILRPLHEEAVRRGHDVRRLIVGEANPALLRPDEVVCDDIHAAIRFAPDMCFVPGDRIPSFIPGLKVQVFHGLNEDKRGNIYPERGLFDLYCTEGPSRTGMLEPLARQRGYFQVRETGWLKLDAILKAKPARAQYPRPQVLFASTFTARLSSAESLVDEIGRLARHDRWQWLVTLHPKIDPGTVAKFKALQGDNLSYHGTEDVVDLLHRADVMVSDNSSILQEFLLLEKPVVTCRNRNPQPCMIDIQGPDELEAAVASALAPSAELQAAIRSYGPSITPFRDGKSAGRILDAAEEMLASGWQDKKPANLWRNFKMRQQHSYYRFW